MYYKEKETILSALYRFCPEGIRADSSMNHEPPAASFDLRCESMRVTSIHSTTHRNQDSGERASVNGRSRTRPKTVAFQCIHRRVDAAVWEGVLWVGAGAEEVAEQVDAVADVDT